MRAEHQNGNMRASHTDDDVDEDKIWMNIGKLC